jgi:hypothetical protein
MFQTRSPDLDPGSATIRTEDHPIATESPYEQKIVVTRPTTPELTEATPVPTTTKTTLTLAHTPLPAVSQVPTPTIPTPTRYRTTAPVLRRIPTPPIRPPSPLPPRPPSPLILRPPQIPAGGFDDKPLQGKEPFVFNGDRQKTDAFIHELKLYQSVNATHPIMIDPAHRAAHALTYLIGTEVYEWKRSMEIWIMSNPVPHPPFLSIYDEFEHDFIKSWTDTNEPHRAAAELNKLRMKTDNMDTYITMFAELTRKALYKENDPTVLEIFKTGLPLKLLEKCMHHDKPMNWDAWTRSAHVCQAILTSLKTH